MQLVTDVYASTNYTRAPLVFVTLGSQGDHPQREQTQAPRVFLGFIKRLWTGTPYLCRYAARDVEPRSGPLEPRSGPPRAAIAPLCGRHPGANHVALTREAVSSCSSCALQRLRPRGVPAPCPAPEG